MKKWKAPALFTLSLLVFLISGGMLLYESVIEPWINRGNIDDYQQLYPGAQSSSSAAPSSKPPVSSDKPADGMSSDEAVSSEPPVSSEEVLPDKPLDTFEALLEKNKDTAGWLIMPGTELNNPVFYTPWEQDYYLKRNPDGSANKYGSLYLSAGSTLNPQAQVMVMYGHNMEWDDLMFGQLKKYMKLSFLKAHPTFTFDTIYRMGEWKIIAVCRASTLELNEFTYTVTNYPTEQMFNTFIHEARLRSHFYIDDDVTANDKLLVMSTCGETFFRERIVVVARRLRDGESAADVSVDRYRENKVMKWPDMYYELDYVKDTPPTDEEMEQGYRDFYGE